MRTFGFVLLAAGLAGFLWAGDRLGRLAPAAEGLTLEQHWDHPAGRLEILRYGSVCAAGIGLLLVFFPKGR